MGPQNELLVMCSTCGTSFETDPDRARRNSNHYCSRECWRESQRERLTVQCEVCGATEEVTPSRAGDYRTCSRECMGELQSREQRGSSNANYADVSTETLVEEYRDGASTVALAKKYEMSDVGVAGRLREAGVDLDDPGYPKTVETERGELVRSYYEKQVADWMFERDIEYEYEPDGFPGPYLPDFIVDGTVIEVWGFTGSEYEAHRAEKERWYASNNITVIGVEPDDIGDLEDRLRVQP